MGGQSAIRVSPRDVLSHSQIGVLSVEQKNTFHPIALESVDSRESVTTGRIQRSQSGEQAARLDLLLEMVVPMKGQLWHLSIQTATTASGVSIVLFIEAIASASSSLMSRTV